MGFNLKLQIETPLKNIQARWPFKKDCSMLKSVRKQGNLKRIIPVTPYLPDQKEGRE
jgi:hypothetical protein